jgi:two-component system sensor histidine kinase/response regulator
LNHFVYSTSHDLRSPLASMMGILHLARMEKSVTDPNSYLNMIETCVNKMDVFIQKIMEFYKSIRVDDEIAEVDFKEILSDSIQICKMQNPLVSFNVSVEQPVKFINDAFRISVIIDNLISNAVKYQKPSADEPEIKVFVKTDAYKALIEIEDNGIGIVEEHLNNIFKMFFRSSTHAYGAGIGLYIVKEALSRIGGDISVSSTYNVGTIFRIIIPNLERAEKQQMKALRN